MSARPTEPVPAVEWEARGWREEPCYCCNGIEWGGEYPREHGLCGGAGRLWISPTGRVADYPGGPFRGSGFPPTEVPGS